MDDESCGDEDDELLCARRMKVKEADEDERLTK